MKVLVHDGLGLWLCARRLHQGRFFWPSSGAAYAAMSAKQLAALVVRLPWQRLGDAGVIRIV